MTEFVDFNDPGISLGKRKQAFVQWLMQRQGFTLSEAKVAAHRKFGPNERQVAQQRQDRAAERLRQGQQAAQRRWGQG